MTRPKGQTATETRQHARSGRGAVGLESFELVVVSGPDVGRRFPVEPSSPTPLLIGTSSACEVRLTDGAVSRRHASLVVVEGGARLSDLQSRNGTVASGLRVYDALLVGGETLEMGATTLRLERLGAVPSPARARSSFGRVVGESDEMQRLYPLLERLAAADVPVVVEGETGTGKEVVAESLHEQGRRRDGPFVVFDCTAVPESLLESALFGHEKGAFTGAVASRAGAFEQAHGGTLLIDEIGELDAALQPKLLRALQRSEFQRVGGSKWTKVDVRVIAATRRDLDREVQAGRFRDDLYYRLNVARVELPPLRRRRGDVTLLARHFWRAMGGDDALLTAELLARFEDYGWPGNVRELYNVVARHLALGDLSWIDARTAPPAGAGSAKEADVFAHALAMNVGLQEARDLVVREFERRYLRRALERHGGNVTRAAEAAGIARRYFYQLLAKLGDA